MRLNTIYNEDCLEGMKRISDESVDLVVTDPPYRISTRGGRATSGGMFQKKKVRDGRIFEHNDIDIEDWLEDIYRVLKPESHCYIMTNNKNIPHYLSVIEDSPFHFIKNLIWVKNNKIMSQTYMSQFEYIIMLRKGAHKKINFCGTPDVLQVANRKTKDDTNKTIHDTEKPVELMKTLIKNSSEKGDVVFDPFMGIGSTALGALELDRQFIGFELDETYHKVSLERIENHDQQLSLI